MHNAADVASAPTTNVAAGHNTSESTAQPASSKQLHITPCHLCRVRCFVIKPYLQQPKSQLFTMFVSFSHYSFLIHSSFPHCIASATVTPMRHTLDALHIPDGDVGTMASPIRGTYKHNTTPSPETPCGKRRRRCNSRDADTLPGRLAFDELPRPTGADLGVNDALRYSKYHSNAIRTPQCCVPTIDVKLLHCSQMVSTLLLIGG